MRTFFSAALAAIAVIANAEQTKQEENYSPSDFRPGSPLMAVGRLGEGLDLALGPHFAPTAYEHVPTAVGPSRYYAPAHTGELGLV